MKVKLEKMGAPRLPDGYRYRVHVLEVYENRVDIGVSILRKRTKTIPFLRKIVPWLGEEVMVQSVIGLPQDATLWDSTSPIVDEAKILHRIVFRNEE